jgi:hypothetical protein
MGTNTLRAIFEKTNGHCHFCGDPITFEHRGWARVPDGHWEVDHVPSDTRAEPPALRTVFLPARGAIVSGGVARGTTCVSYS